MGQFIDLSGKTFFRFKVIKYFKTSKTYRIYWECLCECGNISYVAGQNLKNGSVKSCGCFLKDFCRNTKTIHGLSDSRFDRIWQHLKARCNNTRNRSYKDYGGRGIKCLWNSFEEFKEDMYESYESHVKEFGEKQTTIDRIDVNGNYCKENCRWATWSEQARNTRKSVLIKFGGKVKNISEWCEVYKIPYHKLYQRIFRDKMSFERAVINPIK